jgi:preprotein translocase subunit SecY
VGFRLTKLTTGLLLLLAGAYYVFSDMFGRDTSLPQELSGVVLGLVGVYFLMREVKMYDLFRGTLSAVGLALAVQLGGSGLLAGIKAFSGGMTTDVIGPLLQVAGGIALVGGMFYAFWSASNIRRVLENICSIPELVGKLAFTIGLLGIYRIGFHVPLPGLDQTALAELAEGTSGGLFGDAMEYFSMFTGGNLQQSTLFGLGIMPYITASIIFMLLGQVVPALEKLQKEGPAGQKKIQEYTRYATVGLCIIQASFWMKYMVSSDLLYPQYQGSVLVFLTGVVGLTAGTIFLMWLGEQIDEYGIGNGISLLIMAGIVVRLPNAIIELYQRASMKVAGSSTNIGPGEILFLAVMFVGVVAGAIFITQGQRRIPIQQAKQTRGRRVYGGQRHYMPLRVNHGGVMPIIFASSLMIFPGVIFGWLYQQSGTWGNGSFSRFMNNFFRLSSEAFRGGSFVYTLIYIAMIYFFAYFWTTISFRPKDMADNLRDMGHFIPGLRPGKRTADYLERVMERITYCGAGFLALIAVLPQVLASWMDIPFQISAFLGGTGLLIMVSVTLDLVNRIEANLVMRNYGGFLGGSSRIKGAYG